MQKRIGFYILVMSALILSGCEAFAAAGSANGSSNGEPHAISVTGRGSAGLVPQLAEVSIGVQSEAETAALAIAENNLKMENVIASLESFGVASSDMQTSRFSVYPLQERDARGELVNNAFRVQNSLTVIVRQLDDLGAILDSVVGAGANTISGISFKPDPGAEQAAYDQALAAALADARRKADLLAGAAGVEIVDVISINVSSFGFPAPLAALRAGEGLSAGAEVPVVPGESVLNVEVYVVYEISLAAAIEAPVPTQIPGAADDGGGE